MHSLYHTSTHPDIVMRKRTSWHACTFSLYITYHVSTHPVGGCDNEDGLLGSHAVNLGENLCTFSLYVYFFSP